MKSITVIVIFACWAEASFAQGYFPLEVGDTWFFEQNIAPPIHHYMMKVVRDSILPDGNSYAVLVTSSLDSLDPVLIREDYFRQSGESVVKYPGILLFDFRWRQDSSVVWDTVVYLGPRMWGSGTYEVSSDYMSNFWGRNLRDVSLSPNNGNDYFSITDSIGFNVLYSTLFQNYFPIRLIGCIISGTRYGTILTGAVPVEEINQSFRLSQNFPNPFNPSTWITFSIPSSQHVYLEILDLLGRRITTIVDGVYPAGEQTVEWTSHQAATGVYLYRLRAEGRVAVRKLMILR